MMDFTKHLAKFLLVRETRNAVSHANGLLPKQESLLAGVNNVRPSSFHDTAYPVEFMGLYFLPFSA